MNMNSVKAQFDCPLKNSCRAARWPTILTLKTDGIASRIIFIETGLCFGDGPKSQGFSLVPMHYPVLRGEACPKVQWLSAGVFFILLVLDRSQPRFTVTGKEQSRQWRHQHV